MMDEDPLIPLVHVLKSAAVDNSSSSSAWHAYATPFLTRGDKEKPHLQRDYVGVEIGHIEAEILRLCSRLHHLRTSIGFETQRDPVPVAAKAQPRPRARELSLDRLDVISAAAIPNHLAPEKQPPLVVHLGFDLFG